MQLTSRWLLLVCVTILRHEISTAQDVNYLIQSSTIIKDAAGNQVGPQLALSHSVLKTDEELSYICRENSVNSSASGANGLVLINSTGHIVPVDELEHVGGNVSREACDDDPLTGCTVTKGTIKWRREMGGNYACSAHPDEFYTIHWIDPVALVPQSTDFSRDVYGSNLRFYCSVDMTPTDISYSKIMSVVWHWNSAKTQGNWVILQNNINGVKYQTDSFGANSTLVISNYNPIQHGGEYRCTINILRYADPLESTPFSIQSQPRAQLTNDKRDSFDFGVTEEFSITCYAESYPFPSDIEFRIYIKTLTRDHPGIKDFYVDTLTLNVERHYATFTVTNATSVFPVNNSVIECIVTRPDGEMHPAQERVSLFEVTPPVTATDSPVNPNVRPRQGVVQPWVIVLSILIPVVVIAVLVGVLVWKFRSDGGHNKGAYTLGDTDDPDA